MIRFYKIMLYISLLFLFSQFLYSQKIEVGTEIGFGKSEISDNNRIIISPFSSIKNDYLNSFKFGFMGYLFPKKELFSVNCGLIYNQKGDSYNKLYFLRTPIGLDFNFGKKIKILFGGGIYSQLLVGKKGYFENFKNTKRIFQLGGLVNIGIEYQFLNNIAFIIKCDNNYDFTKIYESISHSPAVNQTYYADRKGSDSNICFCFRYRIKK